MTHRSRLAYLLGEMRREMNGAVVGSMRFYGADYGLNYGVSIPTIRSVARTEAAAEGDADVNHRFAKQLYAQEVRELRLGAFWFASAELVYLDMWRAGIINSEVAEEAAFALMHRVPHIDTWIDEESELLQYCALLAITKRVASGEMDMSTIYNIWSRVATQLESSTKLLPKSAVSLLDALLKAGVESADVERMVGMLSNDSSSTHYIVDEMSWRFEL